MLSGNGQKSIGISSQSKFHIENKFCKGHSLKGVSQRCLMKMKLKLDAATINANFIGASIKVVKEEIRQSERRKSFKVKCGTPVKLFENMLPIRKTSFRLSRKRSLKQRNSLRNEDKNDSKCNEDLIQQWGLLGTNDKISYQVNEYTTKPLDNFKEPVRKSKTLKPKPKAYGQQRIFRIFGLKFNTLRAFQQRKKLRNFVLRNAVEKHPHCQEKSYDYFDFSYAYVVMTQQLLLLLVLIGLLGFVHANANTRTALIVTSDTSGAGGGGGAPAMATVVANYNDNNSNKRKEDYNGDNGKDVDDNTNIQNKNPHFLNEHSNGIVHLFEWKFKDISKECQEFLGPNGYAGVQLSPVTEHLVVNTAELQRPWWERYQPVSYQIATRSGDDNDLGEMLRACNEAGVRVFVEVVLNHMAGGGGGVVVETHGSAGSAYNASSLDYPGVPYVQADFHEPSCVIGPSTSVAEDIRNCRLDGHPDLDHLRGSVRKPIVAFLNKLIGMGVAGFQVHSAKHMWPTDLKAIFAELQDLNSDDFDFPAGSRPFLYMEVLDMGSDLISKTEYSSNGLVSEYLYAAELSTILSGKVALSSLINWGPAMGFLPHQDAYVFIDTPFAQRGLLTALGTNQLITHRHQQKYLMANLFMLAHPYGRLKRIQSSYYFPTKQLDRGPPLDSEEGDDIRSPIFDDNGQCTRESGWVCEHRWPGVLKMLALVNNLDDIQDNVINFQTYGPNHIAFCRGHRAFIAINNDVELLYETRVQTCLSGGVYCDVITGGLTENAEDCHGTRVTVDEEGNADIVLAVADDLSGEDLGNDIVNVGVLAIYEGSKLAVPEGVEKNVELDVDEIDPSMDVEVIEDAEDVADLAEAEEDVVAGDDEEEILADAEQAVKNKEAEEADGEENVEKTEIVDEDIEIVGDIDGAH